MKRVYRAEILVQQHSSKLRSIVSFPTINVQYFANENSSVLCIVGIIPNNTLPILLLLLLLIVTSLDHFQLVPELLRFTKKFGHVLS